MCGFVSKADHSLHLNPSDEATIEWGDRLIVLANDGTNALLYLVHALAMISHKQGFR